MSAIHRVGARADRPRAGCRREARPDAGAAAGARSPGCSSRRCWWRWPWWRPGRWRARSSFSFTDADLDDLDSWEFIGFANYVAICSQDPLWWRAVGNTAGFTVVSVGAGDCARPRHRADAECAHARPRIAARRGADSVGDSDRGLRQDVGLDAARSLRRRECGAAEARPDRRSRGPGCAEPQAGHGRGHRGRRVEGDAVHGAADPGGAAGAAAGDLRGGARSTALRRSGCSCASPCR